MCGITGMVLGRAKRSAEDLEWIRDTFADLMSATEVRGPDASGAFIVNKDGVYYYKDPIPASEIVFGAEWVELMNHITEDTLGIIGHTRWATTGAIEDNDNNHPICIDKIIGVHNGIIQNHRSIKEKYATNAPDVDSSAIFASMLAKSGKKAVTTEVIGESLSELRGDMAIVLADTRRTDSIFVARDSGRPLVFTNDISRKILFMASTKEILEEGLGVEVNTYSLPAFSVARLSAKHGSGATIKTTKWFSTAPKLPKAPKLIRKPLFTHKPLKLNATIYNKLTEKAKVKASPKFCPHANLDDLGLTLQNGDPMFVCLDCDDTIALRRGEVRR